MRACARCGTFFEGETARCEPCEERLLADLNYENLRRNARVAMFTALAIVLLSPLAPNLLWLGVVPFAMGVRGVVLVSRSAMAGEHWRSLLLPQAIGIVLGSMELGLRALFVSLQLLS